MADARIFDRRIIDRSITSIASMLAPICALALATFVSTVSESRHELLIGLGSGVYCALILLRANRSWWFALPLISIAIELLALELAELSTSHRLWVAGITIVQGSLTALMTEIILGRRIQANKLKDFIALSASALAVNILICLPGIIGAILTEGHGMLSFPSQVALVQGLDLDGALGVLTITPGWLLLSSQELSTLTREKRVEKLALASLTIIAGYLVFAAPAVAIGSPPFRYWIFPFTIWGALRFGALGGSSVTALISLLCTWQMWREMGPFYALNGLEFKEAELLIQLFLMTVAASGTALGLAVTEREQSARSLKESQARFAILGANEGLWEWDRATQMIELSAHAAELLGHPMKATTWSSAFARSLIHPDDLESLEEACQASVANQKLINEIARVQNVSGSYRWLHLKGAPFTDANGEVSRLSGSFADITAEMARRSILELIASGASSERTLGELTRHIESLITNSQAAAIGLEPITHHANVLSGPNLSSELQSAINFSKPSPQSRSYGATLYAHRRSIIEDLANSADWEKDTAALRKCGVRAVWSEPVRSEIGDGVAALVVFFTTPRIPTRDDLKLLEEVSSLAGIAITRAEAAEELRERERAYQRVLVSISGVTYRTPIDPAAQLVFARGGCQKLLGYRPAELTARADLPFISLVAPKDRGTFRSKFEHFQRSNEPHECEYRILTRGETHTWVSDQSHGIFDKQGQLVAIEGLLTDISARKESEETRKRLEAELRQASKMEAIGTLAGGIAHDFNNILASVIGFTELAKRRAKSDPAIIENLDHVLTASLRARNLIGQILSFSRKNGTEFRPLSLATIVSDALTFLRATLPASITIRSSLDKAAPIVKANSTQIHQLILNLANNAADSIGGGTGEIEVTLSQTTVGPLQQESMPELTPGRYVALTFRDSGSGISADVLPRIFDPFFTTKAVGKGTGLGLSVVHGIMRSHGGAIRVDSPKGSGAIFTLYFPCAGGKSALEETQTRAPLYGHGERIMFVDDEEGLVQLGTQILGELNYTVTGFVSSAEAWQEFERNPKGYDLVITDRTMPELSGGELIKRIRSVRHDIPIIMITGLLGEDQSTIEQAHGHISVLLKPYTTQVLANTIRSLLSAVELPIAV
jgi:PAS domain S-box-containing protein